MRAALLLPALVSLTARRCHAALAPRQSSPGTCYVCPGFVPGSNIGITGASTADGQLTCDYGASNTICVYDVASGQTVAEPSTGTCPSSVATAYVCPDYPNTPLHSSSAQGTLVCEYSIQTGSSYACLYDESSGAQELPDPDLACQTQADSCEAPTTGSGRKRGYVRGEDNFTALRRRKQKRAAERKPVESIAKFGSLRVRAVLAEGRAAKR